MHRRHIVLVTLALVAATDAGALTTVRPLALSELTRAAGRVVQARVADVRSGADEHGLPSTWVSLDVVRQLKGGHAAHITVKQLGVTAPAPGGTVLHVGGMPRYRVGEEVVLFLHDDSVAGFTSPVGLGQGVFRVTRGEGGAQVRGDATAAAREEGRTRTPGAAPAPPRSLDALLAEIERLVEADR